MLTHVQIREFKLNTPNTPETKFKRAFSIWQMFLGSTPLLRNQYPFWQTLLCELVWSSHFHCKRASWNSKSKKRASFKFFTAEFSKMFVKSAQHVGVALICSAFMFIKAKYPNERFADWSNCWNGKLAHCSLLAIAVVKTSKAAGHGRVHWVKRVGKVGFVGKALGSNTRALCSFPSCTTDSCNTSLNQERLRLCLVPGKQRRCHCLYFLCSFML